MPKQIWLVCEEGSFLIHAVAVEPNGLVVWHGSSTHVIIPSSTYKGGNKVIPNEGISALCQRIGDSITNGVKRLDIRSFERELKGASAPSTPSTSAAKATAQRAGRKASTKKTT